MKKLLIALVLILVLAVVGVVFGGGLLLAGGIEQGGTWALDARTSVDGATLSPWSGRITLDDVRVANPAEFSEDTAVAVGHVGVVADTSSLMTERIDIEVVRIEEPEILIELKPGGTNLGQLLANVQAKTGGPTEPAPEPTGPAPADEAPGKKLRVGHLVIDGARVRLKQSYLMQTEQQLTLPTLELRDLGGAKEGGEGITLPELLEKVLATVLGATADVGGLPKELQQLLDGEIPAKLKAEVEGAVAEVRDQLQDVQQQLEGELKGTLEDVTTGAQDALDESRKALEEGAKGAGDDLKKSVEEGLGGLLGGKKDEKEKDGAKSGGGGS